MLKVFCPSNGKKLEVELKKVSKFFWCNCERPNFLDLRKIANKTKVDLRDLDKHSDSKRDSKLISHKNYEVILLKYPIYKSGKIHMENLVIVFNKKFVITLYKHKIKAIDDFIKNLNGELVGIKKKDYFYFLKRILIALSKEFLTVLDRTEIKLEKIEDNILNQKANIKNLFLAKKNLLYIRKAIVANRNVIADLQAGSSKYLTQNTIPDVYADITQILDIEELFRDRLTSSLDLHMNATSNKMNDIMKSFTVIATLLLIPMLVSSIYGMNIRLPLQQNPNAFYTIMLVVLLSIIITLLYFKIKKWV